MSMFRFWSTEPRGCEKSDEGLDATTDESSRDTSLLRDSPAPTAASSLSPRKRQQSDDENSLISITPTKRARTERETSDDDLAMQCDGHESAESAETRKMERLRDTIQHQFCTEILLRHNELRCINQELAKCQVALEQLRRCHLIPYPVNVPTPEQMLDISNGNGPAVMENSKTPVPQWAPPFGVVDGPYSRHYAKWLIPDPKFDGIEPEPSHMMVRGSIAEGRTTRNSSGDAGVVKGRRGTAGQKLQSLSSGYPPAKDKAGPCVLTRADGMTVKLVCIDCHRDNFSSTQGFINHCRIAHKRDFKSHEEAAVHCGHPYDASEGGNCSKDEKASVGPSATPTAVHPFAREDMTDQEAYRALRTRIADSLKLYHEGKLPGINSIPSKTPVTSSSGHTRPRKASNSKAVPEAPHLSRLLESRNFQGNILQVIADAKTKEPLEDMADEESEDGEGLLCSFDGSQDIPPARTPVVMRMPAKSTKSPAIGSSTRPASSKSRAAHISLVSPSDSDMSILSKHGRSGALSDEDLDLEDVDLSPNTLVSNNAPSLVSDDGEYDDSDEGSSVSGASDQLDSGSVSDVAEITIDDEHETRPLRRGSSGIAGPVRLRKDEAKHVTFIGAMRSTAKERRSRKL